MSENGSLVSEQDKVLRDHCAKALAQYECGKLGCAVPDKDHPMWGVWYGFADAFLEVTDKRMSDLLEECQSMRDKLHAVGSAKVMENSAGEKYVLFKDIASVLLKGDD